MKLAKGQLHHGVSLAPFTSWRIGGEAQALYWPTDSADLINFLKKQKHIFLGLEKCTWWAPGRFLATKGASIRPKEGYLGRGKFWRGTMFVLQTFGYPKFTKRFKAKNSRASPKPPPKQNSKRV